MNIYNICISRVASGSQGEKSSTINHYPVSHDVYIHVQLTIRCAQHIPKVRMFTM